MNLDQAIVCLLIWEMSDAQKAQIGTATANRGPKVKAFLRPMFASKMWTALLLHVIGQNWSGEKVSLFLEDWELAGVALSCHIALDVLCQEMHEACWLGCRCPVPLCHSKESLSLTVDRLSQQRKICGERN